MKLLAWLAFLAFTAPSLAADRLPSGAAVDVGFSPGHAEDVILKGIRSAQQSILVAAYTFTSRPVADALMAAHHRGVDVRMVVDKKENAKRYTLASYFAKHGIGVRWNGRYAIHHNKFMIIDGRHVETGSFNFSNSASKKNAENVILLWNVPSVAKAYTREWIRLWNECPDIDL